jgi:hypothetical protein
MLVYKKNGMSKMKKFAIRSIAFYQKYISILLPKSCRYYPTCSQYAIWEFQTNTFFSALFATFVRILKCNQLFKGGINYPIIRKKFNSYFIFQKSDTKNVNFWFIPCQNSKFYVVKVLDKLKEKN